MNEGSAQADRTEKLHEEGGRMEYKAPLLAVTDMERSVAFYEEVLGLKVTLDFGANKTLTGGLCLQTLETWKEFIDGAEVAFGGNDAEIYFEEDDFDAFAERLRRLEIRCVHPVREHAWGQRVVRFYDPDGHIIEVGENMAVTVKRFADSGMTAEQVAKRMDVPVAYVEECLASFLEKK
jgi:lactoylglutathione lyase